MRHRLRKQATFWKTFVRSQLVLAWILCGFPLMWLNGPPAPAMFNNHASAFDNAAFVDGAIAELLATQTAMEVTSRPLVVCPLGVVPKPGTSKLRLIWDGRYINAHIVCPPFKYETLAELPEVLQPGDYLFTVDLKSGYHHLDMHPDYWQYLGFSWRGKYYVFTQLPFGLSVACWAFTKLMRQLFTKWRGEGHRCSGYLDDSLHAHSCGQQLLVWQGRVLGDLEACGFLVGLPKCSLIPEHAKRYLGMMVDTAQRCMRVPQDKRDFFLSLVQSALTDRRVQVRSLQRISGHLASMTWAFGPIVRLYTRHLHKVIGTARQPSDYVQLTAEARVELQFWSACFDQFNGYRPMWAPTHIHTLVHTDAAGCNAFSFGGWGAWTRLNGNLLVAAGRWRPTDTSRPEASSTLLELEAIHLALRSFNRSGDLQQQTVMVKSDNQAAVALITNGGSRQPHTDLLHEEVRRLFWYCVEQSITLVAEWVPRERNELADQVSKFVDYDDWKLHPRVFSQLQSDWGPFSVDLFASYLNHQLPVYYSMHHTPDAAAVNAFTQVWGSRCWCNPPFKLVGKAWRHAQACGASMALIFPFWPSASWWHQLLASDPAFFSPYIREIRELPRPHDLFLPGSTGNCMPRKAAPWRIFAAWVDFGGSPSQRLLRVPT